MSHEYDRTPILDTLPSDHIAHFLPNVDFAFTEGFEWHDPVWGDTDIKEWSGDNEEYQQLFASILVHPAVRRLIAIEQLTLPAQYETMPNAAYFSRWEHITGSAIVTSKLIDCWNNDHPDDIVTARSKVIYILRTMLSDVAHTVGSHLGDWIEADASEKFHDNELRTYLEKSGLQAIIESYGIAIDEVDLMSVATQDFVECSAPNLCIDRVDYGVREIHRTNPYFHQAARRFTADDFVLSKDNEGVLQLVMKDPARALLFAKSYELLPMEDWSEPLQRLQTTLYTQLMTLLTAKVADGTVATLVGRTELPPYPTPTSWRAEYERNPRDILYYCEGILGEAIIRLTRERKQKDLSLRAIAELDTTMREISTIAKTFVHTERWDEIGEFTHGIAEGSLSANDTLHDRPSLYKGEGGLIEAIAISQGKVNDPSILSVHLPERKKRGLDPQTKQRDGSIRRLSEVSSYTCEYTSFSDLTANIVYRGEAPRSCEAAYAAAIRQWSKLRKRPRLDAEQLQHMQRYALIGLSVLDYWEFTQAGVLFDIRTEQDLNLLQ